MKTVSLCPICNTKSLLTIKKKINRDRADEFLKAALDEYYVKLCNEPVPSEVLSICPGCHSIYRANFFDDNEIMQIYGNLYHAMEAKYSNAAGYVYNKKSFLDGCSDKMFDTVKRIEGKFDLDIKSIFDIGGRDGFRLSKLADHGYHCTVFDPIPCPACSDKIIKENKWSHEIPREKEADLIMLCNVLEHCINPYTVIRNCNEHLHENGVIFIELPTDWRTALLWILIGRFLGYNLSIDATHNIFYSLKGISHLLKTSDFDNIETTFSLLPSIDVKVIETVAKKVAVK